MPESEGKEEELVICVRPDGDVECLYRDELNLDALGPLEVRRASHVEFDPEPGVWVARVADGGDLIARHRKRSVCLDREVRHFNRELSQGLRPFDP